MARENIVPTRFSDEEVADLDARRGGLKRGDWIRLLCQIAQRQNITADTFHLWLDR